MRVDLKDEAIHDLVNGAWFYGLQSPELDQYSLRCLGDDLRTLEARAGIHEKYRGFRRKLATQFPYAIYYRVSGEVVDVVAILDCRRDPRSIDATLEDRDS